MVMIAWVAMLLASNLSVILWRVLLRQDVPSWDPIARIAGLLILLAFTSAWPPLRPLHGYVLAMTALLIGNRIGTLLEETPAWATWAQTAPKHLQVLADMFVKLIPAALMALTLIGSGLGSRDLFLVRGDLSAPSRLPGLGRPPWTLVGPVLTALFVVPFVLQLIFTVRPNFGRVVTALPLALLFAAINAASEEFRFRSVPLARLGPAVGGEQALWLTSTHFAIGHWFGHPPGPTGVLIAGLAGLMAGKSMLETGGFTWAWLMHGIGDVVIFILIATANQ